MLACFFFDQKPNSVEIKVTQMRGNQQRLALTDQPLSPEIGHIKKSGGSGDPPSWRAGKVYEGHRLLAWGVVCGKLDVGSLCDWFMLVPTFLPLVVNRKLLQLSVVI